ncbi:hypothetical protein ACFL4N_09155 [Thermodesulfobacteriota bacterium]
MHGNSEIYAFAASAGALEGYVYKREDLDLKALLNWMENLCVAYGSLPPKVGDEIQPQVDQSLGRALISLMSVLGEHHEIVTGLASMVKGTIPESADDFQKKKWFQSEKDGNQVPGTGE